MKGVEIMKEKSHMSLRTKKILAGIGIGFGTVFAFLVSFILAFSLIINPINFMTVSDADTVKENEELKETVQNLKDENELLNATVDKYKASSKAPTTVVAEQPSVQQTSGSDSKQQSSSQTGSGTGSENETNTSKAGSTENRDTDAGGESEQVFAPETVTNTGAETPEDVEAPITVIEIAE